MPGLIATFWNDRMVGTELERALLVRRRSRYWRSAGVVLIHIPKAAGTTLSEALYGRFLGHIRAADVKRWGSLSVKSLPFVAVTRNPWDRLLSAYRFVRNGVGFDGRSPGAVWRPEQYAVPEFATFERFVTDWLAKRDPRKLDFVFQPQSEFLCDSNRKLIVDHLGRVEDLAPTYEFLRGVVPDLPPLGRSNHSGERVDYRSFYTPDLAQLAASIYAEDASRFGYSFD